MDELFWDKEGGGYFSTALGDSSLVLRMKEEYDGAEPSPVPYSPPPQLCHLRVIFSHSFCQNSYAVMNLVKFAGITYKDEFLDKAKRTMKLYEYPLHDPCVSSSVVHFLTIDY
jgi:hypothetical protein